MKPYLIIVIICSFFCQSMYSANSQPILNDSYDITFENLGYAVYSSLTYSTPIVLTDTTNVSLKDAIQLSSSSNPDLSWFFSKASIVNSFVNGLGQTISFPIDTLVGSLMPSTIQGSVLNLCNFGYIETTTPLNHGLAVLSFNYTTSDISHRLMGSVEYEEDGVWKTLIHFSTDTTTGQTVDYLENKCVARLHINKNVKLRISGLNTRNSYTAGVNSHLYIDNIKLEYIQDDLNNVLDVPTNFEVESYTPNLVSFKWDSVENADSYLILTHQDGTYGNDESDTIEVNTNFFEWENLTYGRPYGLQIVAIRNAVSPAYYNSQVTPLYYFLTPVGGSINKPKHLHYQVTNDARTSVKFVWDKNLFAGEYHIEYRLKSDTNTVADLEVPPSSNLLLNQEETIVSGLLPDSEYEWRIQAHVTLGQETGFDSNNPDYNNYYDSDFSDWHLFHTQNVFDVKYYNNSNLYEHDYDINQIDFPDEPNTKDGWAFLGWTNNENFNITGPISDSQSTIAQLYYHLYSMPGDTLLDVGNNPASGLVSIATDAEEISKNIDLHALWAKDNSTYVHDDSNDPIFFSGYLCGDGNNKAYQLFNASDDPVDLRDYYIIYYSDGNTYPAYYLMISYNPILASRRSFTVFNSYASSIFWTSGHAHAYSPMNFSGNDALILYNRITGQYVDIIGVKGQNGNNVDNTAWEGTDAQGHSASTKNQVLKRVPTIYQGNSTFDFSEWIAYDQDNYNSFFPTHQILPNTSNVTISTMWDTNYELDKTYTNEVSSIADVSNYNNLVINGTSKVEIDSDVEVNQVIMQSYDDILPQLIVNGNSLLTINHSLLFQKELTDNTRWYYFSLPYNCKIRDVVELNEDGVYGTDWIVAEYNKERRAQGYFDSSNWTMLGENATLDANKGYAIASGVTTSINLVFKPIEDESDPINFDKSKNISVEYTAISSDETHSGTLNYDDGWVFIGNPYYYNISEVSNTFASNSDESYIMSFSIPQWDSDSNKYFYEQRTSNLVNLKPFSSYFMQINEDVNQIQYGTQSLPTFALKSNGEASMVELVLSDTRSYKDYLTLAYSDNYSTDYEKGCDLMKMLTLGSRPQLYSQSIKKLAVNAIPNDTKAKTKIGFYVPQPGVYTFKLNTLHFNEMEHLYLNDLLTDMEIDLFNQSYTFNAQSGINDNRFYITRTQQKKDETGEVDVLKDYFPNVHSKNNQVVITGLNENAQIDLYDMTGKLLYQKMHSSDCEIPVSSRGIYTIKIKIKDQTKQYKVVL